MDDEKAQKEAREEALDKALAALKYLFEISVLELGVDAAEAVVRNCAQGGKIRFEIELPPSLSLVCSVLRGAGSVEVLRIEGVAPDPSLDS